MYHWIVNMRLQAILECLVDDVTRSQNKSKLWTIIALSKFQLKKRSTAQNVTNWTGYQKFKFQFHIQISKFWQVRNLRLPFHYLPKFLWNFASMFVWRFVCLLLAKIWQVCSFDRLSVCLFVCLFVRNFFDTGHSFWYIFTKLDPSMYLCHVTMPIVLLGQRWNN